MSCEQYTVQLKEDGIGDAGTVALTVTTTFFGLNKHDRKFVFYLLEVMRAYKDGTLVFPSEAAFHPSSDRKMDLNANVDEIPF